MEERKKEWRGRESHRGKSGGEEIVEERKKEWRRERKSGTEERLAQRKSAVGNEHSVDGRLNNVNRCGPRCN